ncbi:MAG: signal peptidase I, partial [Thomasclavelia sp.]|nr:signal peptidase I [Thomasclavelia sp.]
HKNIIEKIIDWLLNILIVIFGIVLLVSLYTGIQTRILGNKYANFFGYSTFEVQTGSMAETINAGDWIIVKLTQNVKIKDIITYELNGEYITHRVIEAYNGKYTTMGDANSAKDKEPVEQKQIVGKVVKVLGNFGIIRKVLFNPGVLISFMITLFLFNLAIKKNKVEIDKKENNYFSKIVNLLIRRFKKRFTKDIVKVKEVEETIEPEVEEEIIIDEAIEDELAKTSLYRVIPVDLSEIDDTFLEIAKNELKEAEQNKLKKEVAKEETPKEDIIEDDDSLTKINLELLKDKKGNKKSKNVIDTAMFIKREELNELITLLLGDEANRSGAVTIRKTLIDTYIDAKYYNQFNEEDTKTSGKGLVKKLEKVIIEFAIDMIDKYNGKNEKYGDMVNGHATALTLIAKLEYVKDSVSALKARNEFYEKEISKRYKSFDEERIDFVVNGINKIQRNYTNMIEYLLKNLETNMFSLNFNKLSSRKDMYGLELHHNISFNKVYSDYIIDKTYSEGIIAEDKMSVLLNLLSIQIIRDMISFDFNKKYLLYIPNSLYTKEKKLSKLLKMLEDNYAKESIIILISIKDLLSNKTVIKSIRKAGYKYALVFENETTINSKERGNIYVADYIFIDKKTVDVEKAISFIPEELLNSVIYEDVVDKVGDYGSE